MAAWPNENAPALGAATAGLDAAFGSSVTFGAGLAAAVVAAAGLAGVAALLPAAAGRGLGAAEPESLPWA